MASAREETTNLKFNAQGADLVLKAYCRPRYDSFVLFRVQKAKLAAWPSFLSEMEERADQSDPPVAEVDESPEVTEDLLLLLYGKIADFPDLKSRSNEHLLEMHEATRQNSIGILQFSLEILLSDRVKSMTSSEGLALYAKLVYSNCKELREAAIQSVITEPVSTWDEAVMKSLALERMLPLFKARDAKMIEAAARAQ